MNKRKVIIAFRSKTMITLFKNFFEERRFEVFETDNGIDLLTIALKTRPDLIISTVSLTGIDGYNICRIVKNSNELSSTKIILCSVENDTVRRYWADISNCDAYYYIEQSDISSLEEVVQSLFADSEQGKKDDIEANEKENLTEGTTESDLLKLIVQAYDKEFFELNVIKNAFQNASDFDFETMFNELSKSVVSVINYDAIGLVINTNPLVEFYSFNPSLAQTEKQDFIKVCQSDFETKALSVNRFDWKKSKQHFFTTDFAAECSEIKSSESYPSEAKQNLSVSITVGSGRADGFYPRTTQRLTFITNVYEAAIQRAITFNKLATAEDNIAKAFGHFVPQSVINDIVSGTTNNASNAGEKRNVAIMLTDIRSFTSISEINEPEKVVDFLNTFFTIMGRIIKKHGGIIDKFMGDAIMALFGAPESYEDNAARATRAAIEMHQALKEIEIDLKLPAGYKFAIGTGIHYGPVIAGSLGSEEKKEYTVIGDNANIASRLEGLTKIYGAPIIISESVKNDLNGEIPVRHLDNVKVKGKSIAMQIYEVSPDGLNQAAEFYDFYKKALNQYTLGNFIMAIEYLEKAIEINPDDTATKVLLRRCNEYKQHRPENWDGAEVLTTK